MLTGLASVSRERLLQKLAIAGVSERDSKITSYAVPAQSLDALLDCYKRPTVDVLCIDAEGHDFEVLKSFSLPTYKPRLVMLEVHNLSPADRSMCLAHLQEHGYAISRSLGDLIAARIDAFDSILA